MFTANITGLSADTTYYVRAYATNSQGTAYGVNNILQTLPASLPVVSGGGSFDISIEMESGGGGVSGGTSLGTLAVPQGVTLNKSASPSITVTAELGAPAPVGGRALFVDIHGGHSQLKDARCGKALHRDRGRSN